MFILHNISAQPIIPRPIFLVPFVILSISLSGYLFTSITLSKKCTAFLTTLLNLSKSTSKPFFVFFNIKLKFIEPRLHASYGSSGCSPHGLVDSISPSSGVTLSLFNLSRNIIPGSPLFHALSTTMSNISLALSCPTGNFVLGSIKSYFSLFSTAFMNFSVIPTLILKLVISLLSCLQVINSRMSG